MTDQQTIQQRRAGFALSAVSAAVQSLGHSKDRDEFLSYARSFPAMIQMNGLGQAVAFYRMKAGRHGLLHDILANWFDELLRKIDDDQGLMGRITSTSMEGYLALQAEALIFLSWVKMIAKAEVESARPTTPAVAGGDN